MNEQLFQFIWQYSLYQPSGLYTTGGEPVTVISPGRLNHHAGPDFDTARIRIGRTLLVGNVELHIRSSDWYRHGHDKDPAYGQIILHVVYEDDLPGTVQAFPVLVLGGRIPAHVQERYTGFLQTPRLVACTAHLSHVPDLVKESWLNRMLAERWEEKLTEWKTQLNQVAGDWRNLLYRRMAAGFGFKVNATPFLMLAQSLPVNILAKHKGDIFQTEALLFGQAGMLTSDLRDAYPVRLRTEHAYLRLKYQLPAPVPVHLWKFLRLRPANFPTVRIAQFAALVHRSLHLFSGVIDTCSTDEIVPLLQAQASAYWDDHCRFDEKQQRPCVKTMGASSVDNIIINTIAPIQFLYAWVHGDTDRQERALQLLSTVKSERNAILRLWTQAGWHTTTAAQSQALLQLYNRYCLQKRCIECAIGLCIIRSTPIK